MCEVETAELVDPRCDLVEAVLDQELTLAPQARVRRVGHRTIEEGISIEIPHDPAVVSGDLADAGASYEATFGVVEVLGVVHGQSLGRCGNALLGRLGCGQWCRHSSSLSHFRG